MKLNATDQFNGDYKVLRKLVIQGKVNRQFLLNWVRDRGNATAEKAEKEVDNYLKSHSHPIYKKKDEDDWKNEYMHALTGKSEKEE